MLSKPNVNELMGKIDNRYEMAVAVAKRARDIADKRVKEGSKDIKDPVDVAAKEIYEGKVLVIKAKHEEVEEVSEEKEVKSEEVSPAVSEEEPKAEEVEEVEEAVKVEKPKAKKTRTTKSKEAK
jgi:DNA-directed RNA polymerase subunit omega